MQKRKALDSESQPEQKKHVLDMEKHIENVVDSMAQSTIAVMETDIEEKSFATVTLLKEDVPSSSMQDVQGPSSDIMPLPAVLNNEMIRESNVQELCNNKNKNCILANREAKGLSEVADTDSPKQCNKNADLKQYKSYNRRPKNKHSTTSSVAQSSLLLGHDNNTRNISSSLIKISDQTSLEHKSIPLVEKENSDLTGGACGKSEDGGLLCGSNSNSDIDGSISTKDREIETKEENGLVDLPDLKQDKNNSRFINPPSSAAVILKVDSSTGNNMMISIGAEDSGIRISEDDNSNSVSTSSFEMASNSTEGPSLTGVVQGKKNDFEHVVNDASGGIEGCMVCHSEDGEEPKEVKTLMGEKVKLAIHERKGSNDELALGSEDLLDESGKVPEISETSAEGNIRGRSPDCKEPLSPIRGVIKESSSLSEPNNINLLNSFKKEEVSFSFQTEEKVLSGEPTTDIHSETLCDVRSNNVIPSIQNEDDLNIMSCCIVSETTNGAVNEVASEGVLSSDPNNFQNKKLEVEILEPKRNLVSRTRRKLLVLDLNGLLADIIVDPRNAYRSVKRVGGKAVFKRPFCDDFLKFCFDTFDIGVWSSRRKYNVDSVIDYIMGDNKHKLLFCWDQSQCTNTGFKTLENVHKPLILKELKKLWDKEESGLPWEKGDYSPSNTLLVDDSPYKALCNPPYTAIFPHPYHFDHENDTSLGPGGDLRVYLEGLALVDDVRLYVQEHPFGQLAITSSDSSWDFYHQIIEQVGQSLVPTQ